MIEVHGNLEAGCGPGRDCLGALQPSWQLGAVISNARDSPCQGQSAAAAPAPLSGRQLLRTGAMVGVGQRGDAVGVAAVALRRGEVQRVALMQRRDPDGTGVDAAREGGVLNTQQLQGDGRACDVGRAFGDACGVVLVSCGRVATLRGEIPDGLGRMAAERIPFAAAMVMRRRLLLLQPWGSWRWHPPCVINCILSGTPGAQVSTVKGSASGSGCKPAPMPLPAVFTFMQAAVATACTHRDPCPTEAMPAGVLQRPRCSAGVRAARSQARHPPSSGTFETRGACLLPGSSKKMKDSKSLVLQ
jgi:hypothetical protein